MGNYGVWYTCEAVHPGLASYLGFQKLENFPLRTSFSSEAYKVPHQCGVITRGCKVMGCLQLLAPTMKQ